MLHDFLTTYKKELAARTCVKVASRLTSQPTEDELKSGVLLFLGQLSDRLRVSSSDNEDIEKSASAHGRELLEAGLTVGQVVHVYGDVCQSVTELADELNTSISPDEFRTFNLCLDDAIAHAVTTYELQRERSVAHEGAEPSEVLMHELQSRLGSAMLSFNILKRGNVAIGGSTGALLARNLRATRDLVDNSLVEMLLASPTKRLQPVSIFDLVQEVEIEASSEATIRDLEFAVTCNERGIHVAADPYLLLGGIRQLLESAFRFCRPHGRVLLRSSATADRVLVEVEDDRRGLPEGEGDQAQGAPAQPNADTHPDFGLSMCRRCVEASGGIVQVCDLPGRGRVFTIDLPRHPSPTSLPVARNGDGRLI